MEYGCKIFLAFTDCVKDRDNAQVNSIQLILWSLAIEWRSGKSIQYYFIVRKIYKHLRRNSKHKLVIYMLIDLTSE
jgi:hypothetical protein